MRIKPNKKLYSKDEIAEFEVLLNEFRSYLTAEDPERENRAYHRMGEVCDDLNSHFIVNHQKRFKDIQTALNHAYGTNITHDLFTKFPSDQERETSDRLMKQLVDEINTKFTTNYIAPNAQLKYPEHTKKAKLER